jgi:hypothetical protein
MVVQVTCQDITGRTRDELTSLCKKTAAAAAQAPLSEDQKEAASQLLEAFASFVVAGVSVPTDIRLAVVDLLNRVSPTDASDLHQ